MKGFQVTNLDTTMPPIGTVWTFDYTGGEQEFTIPCSGGYKLETWGAQGGSINDVNTSFKINGGYGGYSTGNIKFSKGKKIYINIGGNGANNCFSDSDNTALCLGGYNGGGYGRGANSITGSSSGGGATHISSESGLLSTLENIKNDIYIVAGGGGGSGYSYGALYDGTEESKNRRVDGKGGSGGGNTGNSGTDEWGSVVNGTNQLGFLGTGATQETAGKAMVNGTLYQNQSGSFGKGGNQYQACCGGAGGGGGWYGGGGSSRCHGGAGGGSGYIGNQLLINKTMYCYNCEESSEESTKTISTTCTSETPTENCSKQGNGYARITLISY